MHNSYFIILFVVPQVIINIMFISFYAYFFPLELALFFSNVIIAHGILLIPMSNDLSY